MTAATTAPPDLLAAVVAATYARVAAAHRREPRLTIERRAAAARPDGPRFTAALSRVDRFNIIAECKRRSPSRGVLRAAYDPVAIARDYAASGAAAISVLTEPAFFDGALAHLAAVREAVDLPLLRKDFIVDDYQILEAAAAGADAVLLIAAALDEASLSRLQQTARDLGLAALVEVHTDAEFDRAAAAGASLVGVNNRSLQTLAVDVTLSERLASRLSPATVAVSESGLTSRSDLARLRGLGYHAFLIGERLMRSPSPGQALAALLEPVTS